MIGQSPARRWRRADIAYLECPPLAEGLNSPVGKLRAGLLQHLHATNCPRGSQLVRWVTENVIQVLPGEFKQRSALQHLWLWLLLPSLQLTHCYCCVGAIPAAVDALHLANEQKHRWYLRAIVHDPYAL